MNTQETLKKTRNFIRTSATLKIFSIGLLVLILLIPTLMVSSLMEERESRRDSVVSEISSKWGNKQTITGPFITVPYKSFYRNEKNEEKVAIHYLHLLPKHLSITGEIDPQIRYRSIYEAVLYNTRLNISGNFTIPLLNQNDIDPENVLWEKAVFSVGISDMRGIKDNIEITYDDKKYTAGPGLKTKDIADAGVQTVIPLSGTGASNQFSLQLNLNGSERLHFIPLGETTEVKIKSTWPSPSFNGAFLPTTRHISDHGFNASWHVLSLNRNFPQFWTGSRHRVCNASFGLNLIITADIYQKSIRISKYALMFIVFTFTAFFFSEILNKKRVHPIQYLLIGLAVILFYLLLLAISEHLNFNFSYMISAVSITAIITGYAHGILKNRYFTLTVSSILTILYGYLYFVLQLEDYALIMGSIGLFIVLATVMYITRKINWYAPNKEPSESE